MIVLYIIFAIVLISAIWEFGNVGDKLKFRCTKWRVAELTPSERKRYGGKKYICERTGYILRNRWRPIMALYAVIFHFIDDCLEIKKEVLFDTLEEAENYFKECQERGRFYSPYY